MKIATKFVTGKVPELSTLQGSKAYQLREHLNKGGKESYRKELAHRSY